MRMVASLYQPPWQKIRYCSLLCAFATEFLCTIPTESGSILCNLHNSMFAPAGSTPTSLGDFAMANGREPGSWVSTCPSCCCAPCGCISALLVEDTLVPLRELRAPQVSEFVPCSIRSKQICSVMNFLMICIQSVVSQLQNMEVSEVYSYSLLGDSGTHTLQRRRWRSMT